MLSAVSWILQCVICNLNYQSSLLIYQSLTGKKGDSPQLRGTVLTDALTTEKAMQARVVRHMLIFVASVNFLVLSTMGPRAPAPTMPNTMKRAPQIPAKSCEAF